MECILLAGGLGTRLRDEVKDLPKCLAPVNGQPFLAYVLAYLEEQFVDKVILSLGYRHEDIIEWLNYKAFTFKMHRVIEKEPLGTGGAIKWALNKATEDKVFVLNADTLFRVDLRAMAATASSETKAVVALKAMRQFDRYGSVEIDEQQNITHFHEKRPVEEGLINGGIYLLNRPLIEFDDYPSKFSMETDFLEQEAGKGTLKGFESDAYFIDIGVPEDYRRAQTELQP